MDDFKPLRIVQIGTGKTVHARPITAAIRQLPEYYRHLGIVETDEKQRAEAEEDDAFQGLPFLKLNDAFSLKPDAFLVETDELRLVPVATRILKAGYPVFMDKPGSGNSREFQNMCRIAEENHVAFSMGYMYRTNPAVQKALELVKAGILGEIISFEGQMSCMSNRDYHQELTRFSGGMMYYLGCHIIDLMVQLCGFPREVFPLNTATGIFGSSGCDHGLCAFRYPHAYSIVRTSASEYNGFPRRCIFVAGTKGALEIRPLEIPQGEGLYSCDMRITLSNDHPYAEGSTTVTFPWFKRYDSMMINFAKYVRKLAVNPYAPAYEAKLHDLIIRAQ